MYARTGFPVPVFLCCIFNYLRIQYDTDLLFADDLPGFVIIRVICIFSRGGYFICNIWCMLFTGMAFMARLSARLLPCFFTAVGFFFFPAFCFEDGMEEFSKSLFSCAVSFLFFPRSSSSCAATAGCFPFPGVISPAPFPGCALPVLSMPFRIIPVVAYATFLFKKYRTFMGKFQMWITRRIGKNDGKKQPWTGCFFSKNVQKNA